MSYALCLLHNGQLTTDYGRNTKKGENELAPYLSLNTNPQNFQGACLLPALFSFLVFGFLA